MEGFLERLENRGAKPGTIGTRLASVYAFIRFLVDEGIVSSELLFRKISIKAQSTLRKDINRDDVNILLSVIEAPRDRAMVVLLLRTGLRISELLNIKISDINLEEQTLKLPTASGWGIFDCKEFCLFNIHSLTPPQATGNALALSVQTLDNQRQIPIDGESLCPCTVLSTLSQSILA